MNVGEALRNVMHFLDVCGYGDQELGRDLAGTCGRLETAHGRTETAHTRHNCDSNFLSLSQENHHSDRAVPVRCRPRSTVRPCGSFLGGGAGGIRSHGACSPFV